MERSNQGRRHMNKVAYKLLNGEKQSRAMGWEFFIKHLLEEDLEVVVEGMKG
jgi:hypothetical protein